jgi:hypothetical protein
MGWKMGKRRLIGTLVIVIAIAMVVLGVFRDEVTDVFNKAIRICLECIGIGWLR